MATNNKARGRDVTEDISCLDCVNGLFHCYGAGHQAERYYKEGRFDGCQKPLDELRLCMKLRLADDSTKVALLKQLLVSEKSPTEGVIWELRKPSK